MKLSSPVHRTALLGLAIVTVAVGLLQGAEGKDRKPEPEQQTADIERMTAKLERIVIPRLELKDVTVEEAVAFLKKKSVELDTQEKNPARRGVDIKLKLDSMRGKPVVPAGPPIVPVPGPPASEIPGTAVKPEEARITLSLEDISLKDALRYVAALANLKLNIDARGVSIVPITCELPVNLKSGGAEQDSASTEAIAARLNRIIIPKLEFRDATVREAIEFLRAKSTALDTSEEDVARRGVSLVLKVDPKAAPAESPVASGIPGLPDVPGLPGKGGAIGAPAGPDDVRITLSLSNIPLGEAIRYVAFVTNLKVKIEPYAISIVPMDFDTDPLITKEYKVPAGFIKVPGSASGDKAAKPGVPQKVDATGVLKLAKVKFPDGAWAVYYPKANRLMVCNTADNLEFLGLAVLDLPLPKSAKGNVNGTDGNREAAHTGAIFYKLNHIVIPRMELKDASIPEAIDFLRSKARNLDSMEKDAERRGVNIVLGRDSRDTARALTGADVPLDPSDPRVSISLHDVPLLNAIRYVTILGDLKFKVEPHAVLIGPPHRILDPLITREYKGVRPQFFGISPPSSGEPKAVDSGLPAWKDATDVLRRFGLSFPNNSWAIYIPRSKRLIIHNTEENLDRWEASVDY